MYKVVTKEHINSMLVRLYL